MNSLILETSQVWTGLPELLRVLLLVPGGLLLAIVLRLLVSSILGMLRFDQLCGGTAFGEFLRKGKVSYTPSKLAGLLSFWVCLAVVSVEAVRLLDPELSAALSSRLHGSAPGLFAALLLLFFGLSLMVFLCNLAGTILANAGFAHADSAARILKYFGVMVVIVVALEQVSIGGTLLGPLVLILFASLSFSVALAFGLGCKDIARDFALRAIAAMREKQRAPKADLEG